MLLYFIKVILISLLVVYGVAAASWLIYKALIKFDIIQYIFKQNKGSVLFKMEYLSVDVKTMQVIYYIKEGETKEDLLKRTEEFRRKEINELKKLLKTYDIDIFKSSLNKYENAVYKVMTFDEFLVLQKKILL